MACGHRFSTARFPLINCAMESDPRGLRRNVDEEARLRRVSINIRRLSGAWIRAWLSLQSQRRRHCLDAVTIPNFRIQMIELSPPDQKGTSAPRWNWYVKTCKCGVGVRFANTSPTCTEVGRSGRRDCATYQVGMLYFPLIPFQQIFSVSTNIWTPSRNGLIRVPSLWVHTTGTSVTLNPHFLAR